MRLMPPLRSTFLDKPYRDDCPCCSVPWSMFSLETADAFQAHALATTAQSGPLMDAAAIAVSGGAEVSVTQWRLRDPRYIEIGLGKTVQVRVGLKVAAGSLALYLVEHERKSGHPKQAGVLLGGWIGMQVVPIAINLLQGLGTKGAKH